MLVAASLVIKEGKDRLRETNHSFKTKRDVCLLV